MSSGADSSSTGSPKTTSVSNESTFLPSSLVALNAATHLPLKLSSTNYYSWKSQFDALLFGYDLYGYIDGSKPCPESVTGTPPVVNPDYTLSKRQDKLLLLAIISSLTPALVSIVRTCDTSVDAWFCLAKNFANPSSSRVMGLAERLTLISRGNQSVTHYLSQVRDISDELALLGAPALAQYLITHTLNGVGPAFKEIAAAIRARDSVISFAELSEKLLEYEQFLHREDLRATGTLAQPQAHAATFGQSHNGKKNNSRHPQASSTSGGSMKYSSPRRTDNASYKTGVVCQFCDKKGHVARNCYAAQKLLFGQTFPRDNSATASSSPTWVLDSGASHHVTMDATNLTACTPYNGAEEVQIADGSGYQHGGMSCDGKTNE